MKGKLVKRSNDRFDLYSIEDKNQINTIASSFDNPKGNLSLKNCQAIELGYDLEELAKLFHEQHKFASSHIADITSFKLGFQKALEILGDKKFSEEDMRIAMDRVWNWGEDDQDEDCSSMIELRDKHIQSLQQTEWGVEIVMEYQGVEKNGKIKESYMSKLDENGCLILKKL
jgi:hypothetical protein